MRRKIAALAAIVALVMGVSVFAVPSSSQAATINSVSVTLGSTTWCGNNTNTACGGINLWGAALLSTGGVVSPGATIYLSQTGGTFNFDTSEPGAPLPQTTHASITINGFVFSDTANILHPIDPVTNAFNEARNYLGSFAADSFTATVGYFDNIHTDACADTAGSIAGNCQPDPFVRVAGFADPAINNVFTDTATSPHCSPGGTVAACWDAGVLAITANHVTPEPSTLLLIGTGLIGLAAYGRRHLKKRA